MKRLLGFLGSLGLATTIAVGTANADGAPYSPGLAWGWPGVGAKGAPARFVAFGMPKSTIVAKVRVRDGRVLRSKVLRGFYGVPLVAYDGTAGGLSGDGRVLVLGSESPYPGLAGRTRFMLLDSSTLTLQRQIVLRGSWSFDAMSPDAATLYFTQHLKVDKNPVYRVRPFDVRAGRLRGAIIDRLEGEEEMGGVPVSRVPSADGRWAYTLYARRGDEPFVHALDTAKREAFCIDLSLDVDYGKQWSMRLKIDPSRGRLSAWLNGRRLATVDTRTWEVQEIES
jgi:hypothetical protein